MEMKDIKNPPQRVILLCFHAIGWFLIVLCSAVEGGAKVSEHPVLSKGRNFAVFNLEKSISGQTIC